MVKKKTELDLQGLSRDVDKKFEVLNSITKQERAKSPSKKSTSLNPQTSENVRQLKRSGLESDSLRRHSESLREIWM